MSDNIPQAPDFLKSLLSTPIGSLPKVPIWAISFQAIPLWVINNITYIHSGYSSILKTPDQSLTATLAGGMLNGNRGCLFAQAVTVPGDGFTSNAEGQQNNGLYREYINQGRDDHNKIKISFLDTTISFTENIIRPWVVATSHLGMIARTGDLNYRTDMFLYRWSPGLRGGEPFIYQSWIFRQACPINVSNENIEYTPQSGVIRRDVEFIYQSYNTQAFPEDTGLFLK